MLAIAAGGGLQGDRVRAVVRFGQGEGAGLLQAGHRREPALTLLLVAQHVDAAHAQIGVHAQEGVDRSVDPSHLPGHHAGALAGEPGAAVALDERADDAQLGQTGDQRRGELGLLPPLVDDRLHLLLSEGADLVPQGPLILGQGGVQVEEVWVVDHRGGGQGLGAHGVSWVERVERVERGEPAAALPAAMGGVVWIQSSTDCWSAPSAGGFLA